MVMSETESGFAKTSLEGKILRGVYRLDRLVGKGGMAWVYQAHHLQWQQTVAVKILLPTFSCQEDFRERFLREARVQRQLHHPHILRVFEHVEEQGVLGISMEWIEGGDLNGWLKSRGNRLSWEEMTWLFPKLVEAVGYAHQHGIVHRDLKPANVMMHWQQGEWVPKVMDFGVAKLAEESGLTATGQCIGTPAYMPAEQWRDSKRVDHRADIYSLGVLLYRVLTGQLPFQGDPVQLLWQILHVIPEIPASIPVPVADIILRCLAKDPNERYASCAALFDAFSQCIAVLGIFPQAPTKPARSQDSMWNGEQVSSFVLSSEQNSTNTPMEDTVLQATQLLQNNLPGSLQTNPTAWQELHNESTIHSSAWNKQQAARIDEALRGVVAVSSLTDSFVGPSTSQAKPFPGKQGAMQPSATEQMPTLQIPMPQNFQKKSWRWLWGILFFLMGGIGFYIFWN